MEKDDIFIRPTPNPNAYSFILEETVKTDGNSNYRSINDCQDNPLASELFKIRGVDQVHFFDNVVTITKFSYEDWEPLVEKVQETIIQLIGQHNPDYFDPDPEEERRKTLTQEQRDIEAIFDRTLRPNLQMDGGDIQTVSYEDNVLVIKYQGACGTCPSSTTGTLEAVKAILRDEYNPDIEVYIAPDFW